jgi:hypothetical protein
MPARNNRGATIRDEAHTAVAMERLGKQVSSKANSRNNRTAVLYLLFVPRGYKKDKEVRLSQLSFETPSCQGKSLRAEELLSEELIESSAHLELQSSTKLNIRVRVKSYFTTGGLPPISSS